MKVEKIMDIAGRAIGIIMTNPRVSENLSTREVADVYDTISMLTKMYSDAKVNDVYLPFVIHILEKLTPFSIAKECPGLNIHMEWYNQGDTMLIEIAEENRKSIVTYAICPSRRNLKLLYVERGIRDMYTTTELCLNCETVKMGIYQYEDADAITYCGIVTSACKNLFVLDRVSIIS